MNIPNNHIFIQLEVLSFDSTIEPMQLSSSIDIETERVINMECEQAPTNCRYSTKNKRSSIRFKYHLTYAIEYTSQLQYCE